MGYAIELSFDVRRNVNMISEKQRKRELAAEYQCDIQYFMHEIEGNRRTIIRSDIVQVVIFETDKLQEFLEFVKIVRKDSNSHIECIYQDDCTCELLYASPKYLKKVEKKFAKTYTQRMKTRVPNELELMVLQALKRH